MTTVRLVSSDAERRPGEARHIAAAVASLHSLGAGLWGELKSADGNLALSPYSVAAALAMTVNGARGTTRSEMLGVLAAETTAGLNAGLNALTQHVQGLGGPDDPEIALDAANQLFGQMGVRWAAPFLDVLARDYGAGIRTVDFAGATEVARSAVNQWTAEQTHDRIEQILPPGSVDTLTRLVLVDALYFKAPWLEPFEKSLTVDADFHLADGTVVRVPTMRATRAAVVASGDGWTSVRIPYAGDALAMTVVLPGTGREVDLCALPEVLASGTRTAVELALPRWTFRTEVALRGPLTVLGMPTAFDGACADLTAMAGSEVGLALDDVHHQVFVAVDEAGTEAAAATAVVARGASAMITRQRVVVDRPFVFAIHDVEHGTPLFVGRVADPRG